jgi:hypothetical protein
MAGRVARGCLRAVNGACPDGVNAVLPVNVCDGFKIKTQIFPAHGSFCTFILNDLMCERA